MARPIPLGAIRVFDAAARHQSFKLAAAELSVTPGAVSRQIATLERRLGAALFLRQNRKVSLTGAGQRYFRDIRGALAAIDAASERLAGRGTSRIVRVDATPTFALHWLIPRLPRFHAKHRGIELRLTTSVGPINRGQRLDWALRRDPAHFRGLRGIEFLEERSLLVAAPALLARHRLARPADLDRCRLIRIAARTDLWPKWFAAHRLSAGKARDTLEFDQTIYAIQAVLEGLGVAVLPELFVRPFLKSGSLVCPLDRRQVRTGAYHLVARNRQPGTAALQFRDWIVAEASARGSEDSPQSMKPN